MEAGADGDGVGGAELANKTWSLWIEPGAGDAELAAQLTAAIASLAGEYGTPAFRPHVTLLGAFEATAEAACALVHEVASQLQPFEVGWGSVRTGVSYYQAVFLACERSAELLAAHERASVLHAGPGPCDFMPHLSLMYTDADAGARTEVAAALQRRWPELGSGAFVAHGVRLMETDPGDTSMASWRSIEFATFGDNCPPR